MNEVNTAAPRTRRLWRIIAMLAGAVGALLAVSVPLLPVNQEQASFSWPATHLANVTAPLLSYSPVRVDAQVPCAAISTLGPQGGTLLSTVPPASATAHRYGLNVTVTQGNRLQVGLRDRTLIDTAVAELPPDCRLLIASDSTRTTVDLGGNPVVLDGDYRPQLVGLFTDLTGAAPSGMQVRVLIDSRFTTSPTVLKLCAIIGALVATALALVAVHRLDRLDGRRRRRVSRWRRWRPRPIDGVVVGILVLWYFIGAGTTDDGYVYGMVRARGHAGYLANYFTYFGVPESPMGLPYYHLFELLAHVSTASIVLRLPELVAGVLCWLLISREVVPRLGIAARTERAALWAGAGALLAFWLPYNNGLRPEPPVALGVLLTWVLIERALATRRLTPAVAALIPAALSAVTNPAGLICLAALLAGARPLAQLVVARARTSGYASVLAPAAAAGVVVLTIVFAGLPVSEVATMWQAHTVVGPEFHWYDEYFRYRLLFQSTPDGSVARRFAMLFMFLTLAVAVSALLYRKGRIPGLAAGPARRIVGTTLGAVALMAFTPTKFTHHFGVFAGLAGAVAVVAVVAVGPRSMRSARNRTMVAAAAVAVLALALASENGWWYVAGYGVPWWDKPVAVQGISAGTAALAIAVVLALIAGWFHIREPFRRTPRRARQRIPVLAVAVALMIAFEVISLGYAAVLRYPAYSPATSNFSALAGKPCGLADAVLVEPDPNAGLLQPLSGNPGTALGAGTDAGFTPDGADLDDLTPDPSDAATGTVGKTVAGANSSAPGGGSGKPGKPGINGSTIPLPYTLDPAITPVLGSYGGPAAPTKKLISDWYRLPAPDPSGSRGELVTITAAGHVASTDVDNVAVGGANVRLEYGVTGDDGVRALGAIAPDDVSGLPPSWRNLRIPLPRLPAEANVVRIVAVVDSSDPTQWVAVTPPRVPQLRTLDALVGHTDPVLLDWLVGLHFPCQQPFRHRDGVAEIPEYRITPDYSGAMVTGNWEAHDAGGVLGYTQLLTRSETLPSYLKDDWKRDWGSIDRFVPLDAAATPARLDLAIVRRPGWWSPGPLNLGIR
ncbi:arabinosyltransferase domain-containing protein [Nocardia sp. NPDC060256]|uniref:arabinosyltransferase domain-containing protein n=1 Tax=unclassified Nocardia TaxID=2637762 RepID=UPI003663E3A8